MENKRERWRGVRIRGKDGGEWRIRGKDGVENEMERWRGVEIVGRDSRPRAATGDKKKKKKRNLRPMSRPAWPLPTTTSKALEGQGTGTGWNCD